MIINQITKGGGTTPTGSVTITNNGTYDVTDKATAVVNVPTTAPAHYIEKAVDANGKLIGGSTVMNFNGVTDIGNYALAYAYYNNTNITGTIDMSSLTTISGEKACFSTFYGCTGITTANFPVLTTVNGSNACSYMFAYCRITTANFSALTTLSGYAAFEGLFAYGTGLTTMTFPLLKILTGYSALQTAFVRQTSLTSLSFPALTSTSFGSYTNQFKNMLQGVTGCTVHFPSNLQSVIGSWADVIAGFGGTNTTVLFDLPATE